MLAQALCAGQKLVAIAACSLNLNLQAVENEMAALKDKVAVILEKTRNDDRLIAALRTEVAALKQGGGGRSATPDPSKWPQLPPAG